MDSHLPLSVIICTHNRAGLLGKTLESLTSQTLPKSEFEVVVVDDGSYDTTAETVRAYRELLPLKYFRQANSGLASARNHGIFSSRGEIALFLDDDDVATGSLLQEHMKSHRQYPDRNYAVLHHTSWAPELTVTPLMHFITEVGCYLFSYPQIRNGDVLDYRNFWGGRVSCKRSFLLEHGVFNPVFTFGNEDTELGYRLSKHGLRVVYNADAVAFMARPIDFDAFCRRLVRQGRSNFVCSILHPVPEVLKWCEVEGARERWHEAEARYDAIMDAARELDRIAEARVKFGLGPDENTTRLLHQAYWQAFPLCKLKGIVEEGGRRIHRTTRASTYGRLIRKSTGFTAVALMCVYNEGDIISHSLKHLIENGISVYLLDHNSTDDTVREASQWLGKGLIHIEKFPQESGFPDELAGVFALRAITQRAEQLHDELGADWYLHYDADEFREAPWPGMTLKEAILLVDGLGYNAINFELFDFRPTDNSYVPKDDVRKYLKYYEPPRKFDEMQTKAWKNTGQTIDLSSTAGHMVSFEGRRIFPVNFITLHFPVRSREHGLKKIVKERAGRFDEKERQYGWHRQYESLLEQGDFVRDKETLKLYDPHEARLRLWTDAIRRLDASRE